MANIGDEIIDGNVRWIVRDTKSEATTISSGLMSAADKIKLNGYPSKTTGNNKYLREDGTWVVPPDTKYTLTPATTSSLGGVMVGNNISISSNGKIGVSLSGNANHVLKGDGTWGSISITSVPSTALTPATRSNIGGVIVGDNISVSADGKIGVSIPGNNNTYLRGDGTWAMPPDTKYTLTPATRSDIGGVIVGDNISISSNGKIGVSIPGNSTTYLRGDGTWATPSDTKYTLTPATTSSLGGVMVGNNISISSNGKIGVSIPGNSTTYLRGDGTWATPSDTKYTLTPATTSSLGGVMVGNNISISSNGKIGVSIPGNSTTYLRGDGTWATPSDTKYTLTPATTSSLGGVMVGNNISISSNGKIGVSLSGNANHVLKGDGTWGSIAVSSIPSTALTPATRSDIGGVIVGDNISVASNGKIGVSVPGNKTTYLRGDGTWATPPDTDTKYTLTPATTSSLGGVMVGNNISISSNGKIGVSIPGNSTTYLRGDGTWATPSDTKYTLTAANTSSLGGVKTANNTGITVGSDGVISLNAASRSAIGGIKFPGGTSSVLSAEGTWVTLNNEVNISESTLDSLITSKKVYNLFKNQVDSNTTTQLAKDNLFLAGDGSWKPFIVNPPKQRGYIVYDGENHVPDFSADLDTADYDVVAISPTSTVASIQNYVNYVNTSIVSANNGNKGRIGLTLRNGQLSATDAGVYFLQIRPKNNYVWSTAVVNWRGLTQYDNTYVGTQLPIVTHWVIRKAPNNISLSARRAEASFGENVNIEYSTDSGGTVTVNQKYEDWGVAITDSRYSGTEAKAKGEMSEYQKGKLPFLSKSGYFSLNVTTDDVDTTQKILQYTMLRRMNWSTTVTTHKKLKKQINNPSFTISSAGTENYYSKSSTVKFINTCISPALDFWDVKEGASDIILTNTKPKVIRFKYESDQKPTITITNSGLLDVKLLEDVVNDIVAAKTNDGKNFDYILKNNNVTGLDSFPTNISIPSDKSGSITKPSTTTTSIISAIEYLTNSTLSASSGTLYKNTNDDPEQAADYNEIKMDEVRYPYLICMPLNGEAEKKWFYLESDYEFISSRKVKYWDNTSEDETNHKVNTKVELYKHYRSLTLIIIPKGSSGQTKVKISGVTSPNFLKMANTITLNISINPSAATSLTGKENGDPIALKSNDTNSALTTAIERFGSGDGANYYKVGDYIPFKFTKELELGSKDDSGNNRKLSTSIIYKAILIGINHGDSSHEHVGPSGTDTNAGHFMIGKDPDNVQICFYGKQMNSTATNDGGWAETSLRTWLNDAENGFLSALPKQLQDNIQLYSKTSATTTNGSTGITTDKIWLMSKNEMHPQTSGAYVVANERSASTQYQYFLNGNSKFFYDQEDNTIGRMYWFRSMRNSGSTQFVKARKEEDGQGEETYYSSANSILGFIPCFVL